MFVGEGCVRRESSLRRQAGDRPAQRGLRSYGAEFPEEVTAWKRGAGLECSCSGRWALSHPSAHQPAPFGAPPSCSPGLQSVLEKDAERLEGCPHQAVPRVLYSGED